MRLAQSLVILLVSWVAYALVRAWLEHRRPLAGRDDRTLQHPCALARSIVLIVGLILAGVTVGLVAAEPVLRFLGAFFGGLFGFLGTLMRAAAGPPACPPWAWLSLP